MPPSASTTHDWIQSSGSIAEIVVALAALAWWLWWRRSRSNPLQVEAVRAEAFRESGSEVVGVDLDLLLATRDGRAHTIHDLFWSIDWGNPAHLDKPPSALGTAEVDGMELPRAATTNYRKGFVVDTGTRLLLRNAATFKTTGVIPPRVKVEVEMMCRRHTIKRTFELPVATVL